MSSTSFSSLPPLDQPSSQPDDSVEKLARRFHALADPLRLRILLELEKGPCAVQELARQTQIRRTTLTAQLAILHRAGLVDKTKNKRPIRYVLLNGKLPRCCDLVAQSLTRQIQRQIRALE